MWEQKVGAFKAPLNKNFVVWFFYRTLFRFVKSVTQRHYGPIRTSRQNQNCLRDFNQKLYADNFSVIIKPFRDGPLENLWGGAGEVQKKNSRKGKLNEKKFMHAN